MNRRFATALALALCPLVGCFGGQEQSVAKARAQEAARKAANAVPAEALSEVLAAHLAGVGHMERYEYALAAKAFRKVRAAAPDWLPGRVNLALALLNDTGRRAEEARKGLAQAPDAGPIAFDEALSELNGAIARDPRNKHARFCRAIILRYDGDLGRAHEDFKVVTEEDPHDAQAWFQLGMSVCDPADPTRPITIELAERAISCFQRALEENPNHVNARYAFTIGHNPIKAKMTDKAELAKMVARQTELLALWKRLDPKNSTDPRGPGDAFSDVYGEAGKYATVIDPVELKTIGGTESSRPPTFGRLGEKAAFVLPAQASWTDAGDFVATYSEIGLARARFGGAIVVLDANRDGRDDLYMAGAVKDTVGPRDGLFLNQGEGRFVESAALWGVPHRSSLTVAAADFDADGFVDLFLGGVGEDRLLRNQAGKTFLDVADQAGLPRAEAMSVSARWLDLDQDGDLDLYVVRHAASADALAAFGKGPVPPVGNAAYRNDGVAARVGNSPEQNAAPAAVATEESPATQGLSLKLVPWPDAKELVVPTTRNASVTALDVDDDRDLDLVLGSFDGPAVLVRNDRLGRFVREPLDLGAVANAGTLGLLTTELDGDGLSDLVAIDARGTVHALRNQSERGRPRGAAKFAPFPIEAVGWRQATTADYDLDGRWDVIGTSGALVEVARNQHHQRFRTENLPPWGGSTQTLNGFVSADLVGDALPELLILRDKVGPVLRENQGNGRRWLALDLSGRWKVGPDQMRTNPHGIGTKLAVRAPGLDSPIEFATLNAGPGQSVAPLVVGLGEVAEVPLVSMRWPDGVMQCELNVSSNQTLALVEKCRKVGSCPVLFTWNGRRFVCVGDFLGGGGLGYLVAPGIVGQPDRDETVAIGGDQLRPVGGAYRISVTEPMDEVAYLDHLALEVIDRPPGADSAPDERFAPEGPRPTGEPIAWRESVRPVKATDHKGVDRTGDLAAFDRATVDGFERRRAWVGYAEDHHVVLDFGDRLAKWGRGAPLTLVLAGWVEYPYSQTNYAAATAGVALRPPVIERERPDGSWEVVAPSPGYPAGMPRRMTVDLTGKLSGPSCKLRISTNMECYWDEAFVALRADDAAPKVTRLQVARAQLRARGYTREISPDGKLPLIYDYDYVDAVPLAKLNGALTRFGDVAELLRSDDDQLCVLGPGDEAIVEFDATGAPPLAPGWTRAFALRSYGYCKDADPATVGSDDVGPLPWKGMPAFPFGPEGERPKGPDYQRYLETYQTRRAQGH